MINKYKVKKFCKDYTKIENYDKAIADKTQTWDCHHRLELIETGAVVDSSRQDLIDWEIYYDRPADELVFLTNEEHHRLHMLGNKITLGYKHTDEAKRKISEASKSRPSGTKGKHWKLIDGKRIYFKSEMTNNIGENIPNE